jgi:hypothetical protein
VTSALAGAVVTPVYFEAVASNGSHRREKLPGNSFPWLGVVSNLLSVLKMSEDGKGESGGSAFVQRRTLLRALAAGAVSATLAPVKVSAAERADRVVVRKSQRKVDLYRGDAILRSYDCSLGLSPTGHKRREGDFRTPEGSYYLDTRNFDSDFFLSIRISYPNDQDFAWARENGFDPGNYIMIHGLPNNMDRPVSYYSSHDWTNGCVAVSNADIVEIWMLTDFLTPIDILA